MARKRASRPIDILAAAAADHQILHANNDDQERSGSGSESNKLSGSDPDSMVIPKPIEERSPHSKPSRKRSLPKHLLVDDDSEHWNKNARVRVDKFGPSNRLWSEQDEIGILQGMIDFKLQKGKDAYADTNAFHEFVKDSISVSVSKKQLTDKIRRLKLKCLANAEIDGIDKVVKPHEGKLLELWKKIWEGESPEDGNVVENNGANGKDDVVENGAEVDDKEGGNVVEDGVNGKVGVAGNQVEVDIDEEEEGEGKNFKKMYPYLSRAWESDVSCSALMKNFLMDNIRMVGSVGLREMDKKWKNVYVEQLKLYVKRLDLVKEHTQAVLDQLATSDS